MGELKFEIRIYEPAPKGEATDRELLKKWPEWSRIEALLESGLTVDATLFLINSMFREQSGEEGWRTYDDLRAKLPDFVGSLRHSFSFDEGTVSSRRDPESLGTNFTEQMGVGVALSVANQIFDLHEADWSKITTGRKKTLDHILASTGDRLVGIEVEAKGTVRRGLDPKNDPIYAQAKSIREKKGTQRGAGREVQMLGVVGVFSTQADEPARIYLLDPPLQGPDVSPRWFKLLARLRFYTRTLSQMSRSTFAAALASRVDAIAQLGDPTELDELPIKDPSGTVYRRPASSPLGQRLVGRVVPLDSDELFVHGLAPDVFPLLRRQRFESILAFRSGYAGIYDVQGSPLVSVADCERRGMSIREEWEKSRDGGYVRIPVRGRVGVGASGRAFGIVRAESRRWLRNRWSRTNDDNAIF